ncbi:MAG: L-threonylcarbamoyladenylate synthase [Candidatus Latescibacterota bacterium]
MNQHDSETIRKAAAILRSGGVIVYPTETVYGIGCDPWNREACERILLLKRRESARTMLLLADSRKMAEETFGGLDALASRLADRFWPGPVTLIFRSLIEVPEYLRGPSGGVALRVTVHPVAAAIIHEFGKPIISTSANLSGQPPVTSGDDAVNIFGHVADMVVSGAIPPGGVPSTVVDTVSGRPELIREGAIPFTRILEESEP